MADEQERDDRPTDPLHPAAQLSGQDERFWTEILEPHSSLRYIARLFKVLAVLLLLLLVAEVVMGLTQQGQQAIPVLLVEATRIIVFAGVLWGIGDLALMFIETNHDVRASRVLLWQLNSLEKMRLEREGIDVALVEPPQTAGEGTRLE